MRELNTRLLIIGAGPGGYVCAIRAGQLGVETVIVEAVAPGGTCLNVGCIPSKALIHVAEEFHRLTDDQALGALGIRPAAPPVIDLAKALAWKDALVGKLTTGVQGLLRKAKVRLVIGEATIRDGKSVRVDTPEGPVMIYCESLVIATGSEPVALPDLPFGGRVISSTEALTLSEVPETLAVVGGGYIGLELGTAFAKLGARVTVVEAGPRILPQYDAELTKPVTARLAELGVRVMLNARAGGVTPEGALRVAGLDGAEEIPAERILVTAGRRPRSRSAGIEGLNLAMEGPYLRIDERARTSMRGVYAIGDVTGEPMLAHRAMAQGELVAEIVAGHNRVWDKRAIPAVCFTDPEIVTLGLSPAEAGPEALIGVFPFAANGRAMTAARTDGFVRIIARAGSEEVLGIQAVGAGVSELAAGFALAVEMGACLSDVASTIHAHPTRGEALQEASLAALGRAIHM